jgi:hypothetical protein
LQLLVLFEFFHSDRQTKEMQQALNFILAHIGPLIGITAALFLATVILLLIRMIGDSGKSGHDHSIGDVQIDLGAIEGAMKRVLSSQTVMVATGVSGSAHSHAGGGHSSGAGATASDGGGAAGSPEALRERDQKIETLAKELARAKADLESATANAGAAGVGMSAVGGTVAMSPGDDDKIGALTTQIEGLQARLAEYEIIEDDIADLTHFKEENVRLNKEVEELKAKSLAVAEATPVSKIRVDNEQELKFEKAEKFELDANDDIMKQFAAAVDVAPEAPMSGATSQDDIDAMLAAASAEAIIPEMAAIAEEPVVEALPDSLPEPPDEMVAAVSAIESAPAPVADIPEPVVSEPEGSPLSGSLDTDKMLSEVASLDESTADSGDALSETLDTDKLLAEVGFLEAETAEAQPDDDLLAEFKDTKKSS